MPGQRCFIRLTTTTLFTFGFPGATAWRRWYRLWKCAVRSLAAAASASHSAIHASRSFLIRKRSNW
ncbi:MAG: hypothetical protein DME64_00815 [Verrucomicrobia bacterium]|nr:MAG: hypothetical protein DME64_00815 [Verrucomicrobiota bacterium]